MKRWNSIQITSKPDRLHILVIVCLPLTTVASSCALASGTEGKIDRQLEKLLDQAGVGPPEMDIHPSPEKIALGETLFWDPELSGNRDTACVTCHHPGFGTGDDLSLPVGTGGRGVGSDCDLYAFRTPPLRNVAVTGPWMHNGAYTSLSAAVRHQLDPLTALEDYDVAQLAPDLRETVHTDPGVNMAALNCQEVHTDAVELTQAEFDDLIAFLNALTSPTVLDLTHLIPKRVPSGLEVGGR